MPTEISAPLPDLDWKPGDLVTIDLGDPGALITSITLRVTEDDSAPDATLEPVEPIFVYTNAGTESPGLTRG